VVSSMGSTTDRLLEAARSLAPTTALALLSQLLATGEEASVALLCIALTSTGVNAVSLPTEQFGLRTHGALSDANPVAADTSTLAAALATHDVVVLPGFVGRDASGAPSLLGRGGSDLTALFLGDALDASEVRLVKDVDGVYSEDPKSDEDALVLTHATWDEVRRIGGGVVQEKAISFAELRCRSLQLSVLHLLEHPGRCCRHPLYELRRSNYAFHVRGAEPQIGAAVVTAYLDRGGRVDPAGQPPYEPVEERHLLMDGRIA